MVQKAIVALRRCKTLLLHNLQISANVTLYKKLPFNTEKDLEPIIFVNRNPLVLVGRASIEANDWPQLVALMKTLPGAVLFATHDLDAALDLEARVIVLEKGKVVADGAASEVLTDASKLESHGLELPLRLQGR